MIVAARNVINKLLSELILAEERSYLPEYRTEEVQVIESALKSSRSFIEDLFSRQLHDVKLVKAILNDLSALDADTSYANVSNETKQKIAKLKLSEEFDLLISGSISVNELKRYLEGHLSLISSTLDGSLCVILSETQQLKRGLEIYKHERMLRIVDIFISCKDDPNEPGGDYQSKMKAANLSRNEQMLVARLDHSLRSSGIRQLDRSEMIKMTSDFEMPLAVLKFEKYASLIADLD